MKRNTKALSKVIGKYVTVGGSEKHVHLSRTEVRNM